MYFRSQGRAPGRDGCRTPLPWAADEPYAGFGSTVEPWLPLPDDWAAHAADLQATDPASMLALYREALRQRRNLPELHTGQLRWLSEERDVLVFARGATLVCVVNLAEAPAELPDHTGVLLASNPLDDRGRLPKDTAVWLAV
ncbi:Glycoside hydrolase family 13 protein OS=Streptomyces microflavus OX=1919 GN=HUT09_00750 PE=4 SV=1 [Streptomyces microflavus]